MSELHIPANDIALLQRIYGHLQLHNARGWLVGGSIRDLLLGRATADLDLAVDGNAVELARSFADAAGGAFVLLDDDTGTARIVWPAAEGDQARTLDLARLRAATIEDDLRARDFTINALALPLDALSASGPVTLIDPVGGRQDLERKIVRACGTRSIADDPLRMLRAVRLAAQLECSIDDDLTSELRALHALTGDVSSERVRDELMKLLALPGAGHWVRYLDDVRLLTTIIPELEPARTCDQPNVHYLPVLDHVLEAVVAADWLLEQIGAAGGGGVGELPDAVWAITGLPASLPFADRLRARFDKLVDGVPRRALFKLAVLLHDVAKPRTKALKPDGGVSFYEHQTIGGEVAQAIGRRLRLSRAGCDYVRTIVREHMRPGQLNELGPALTMRAVYRFFRATGDAGPEVLLHSLCDHLATKGPNLDAAGWAWHVAWTGEMLTVFYDADEVVRPAPILRGDDLTREFDLSPGPIIGRLLEAVREAQAGGEVHTREEALQYARRELDSIDASLR